MDGFRGPQVCAIVGITYRQLDYWARTGLMTPSISDARGSGTQRLYSYEDLLRLKVIKKLLDSGVSLRQARKAIECLETGLGENLATANLVMSGSSSVLAATEADVVDLLRGNQLVFSILPMSGIVGDLDAAIHDLHEEADPIVGAEPVMGSAAAGDPGAAATAD